MIGTIKVKIEGLNAGKIINHLIDKGVYLKNLKERYRYIVFEIDERDEKDFKDICRKFHKKYEILSKHNVVNLLKKSKCFFGFTLALIIVSVFVFSFNLYVFEVNLSVSSDFAFDTENVKNLLKENGIYAGMKKDGLDKTKLQNLIISSQDNIAGCSVKQTGGKLDIVIYPGILKEEVSKKNIYSKYNAIISKVDIFAGKSGLKIGDFVKIDDLLIENDNGASGEILGKIYFSDYLIYNENQTIKEFTGNFVESSNFMIADKILFKTKQNIDFINYSEENCVFYVSKNNFIPLKILKTIYKEFVFKDVIVKFSEMEEELKNKLYSQVFEKVDDKFKDKITNVTYSVVTEDNLTRLDCFVECEIDLVAN